MPVAGADRVTVDSRGIDAFATLKLDHVVEAQQHRAGRHEGVQQKPKQDPGSRPSALGGAVQYAVVVDDLPLLVELGETQNAGHRAAARCQDGPDQQHFSISTTPLLKERCKTKHHCGKTGWQVQHGGYPLAGTP